MWRIDGEEDCVLTWGALVSNPNGIKKRYWKNEANSPNEKYSRENIELMKKGRAPLHDEIGVPKELVLKSCT